MKIVNGEKKLIDKLVENIDGNKTIYNTTLNDDGSLCNSCTIYIILLVIFLVSISISSAFIYFYWYLKRRNTNTTTNTYTNNGTVIYQYKNMLY